MSWQVRSDHADVDWAKATKGVMNSPRFKLTGRVGRTRGI